MNSASVMAIDRSEYKGAFGATLREKVFCSDYWQTICCNEVETSEGLKFSIDLSSYPPGGAGRTAMRRCRCCGRWAPPSTPVYSTPFCVDCAIDREQEAFQVRMRRLHRETGDPELVRDIIKLYWKRAFIRSETKEEQARLKRERTKSKKQTQPRSRGKDTEKDKKNEFDISAFPFEHIYEPLTESLSSFDCSTFDEQQTTGGRHWLAESLEMAGGPARRPSINPAIKGLHKNLKWASKHRDRRAVGCWLMILPEDEQSLREEIAEFQATGRVKPTTTERGRPERYKRISGKLKL